MDFVKHEKINIKRHPIYNEKWVQNIIANDPSILGLGDLELKDFERAQSRAGRLDLLLRDPDSDLRYEVELQLGATDESHIIRTLEYWDNERKRYPQLDHCAVIIAEDITSRFLNVISLFNGYVPLIAIKMEAIKVGDKVTLVFTKVLDKLVLGVPDEDEADNLVSKDRPYWETIATKLSLQIVDNIYAVVSKIDPDLSLKYNKRYIGLGKNNIACNFVWFKPRQKHVNFQVKLPKTTEVDELIKRSNLEVLEYKARNGNYSISLSMDDVRDNSDVLSELAGRAYERYFEE